MAAALLSLTECCGPSCNSCINLTLAVLGGSETDVADCCLLRVKSYEEARALPTLSTNNVLHINGNEPGGEPGEIGIYTWVAVLDVFDDGANYIKPSDGGLGGWVRET